MIKDFTNMFIEGPESHLTVSLTSLQTQQLLKESHRAYHTEINDILLTALSYGLSAVTNSVVHHIVLEGHGREEINEHLDISRTLGWFTTMYPIRLSIHATLQDSLKSTKEILRRIPNKGNWLWCSNGVSSAPEDKF